MEISAMEFKDILKDKRLAAGLTQTELGDKIGIDSKNISKYENGKSEPNIDTLTKMSEVFNCSVDELLGKDVSMVTVKTIKGDTIRLGFNDIPLEELEKLSLADVKKMLEYLHSIGIDISRYMK